MTLLTPKTQFRSIFGEKKDWSAEALSLAKAAEAGNDDAQTQLGLLHYNGTGVPKNYAEAAKWFRKAAEQGSAHAQSILGHIYWYGEGVPKDFTQAHAWINISAANGFHMAKLEMPIYEDEMTPTQIAEAQKLARELWEKLPKK